MKLEEQCITLEQAVKFLNLKFKKEALFNWVKMHPESEWHLMPYVVGAYRVYPAYTVAELGEMLPDGSQEENRSQIRSGKVGSNSVPRSKGLVYMCHYNDSNGRERTSFYAETEAQARAAMLIHLLENNLIPKP